VTRAANNFVARVGTPYNIGGSCLTIANFPIEQAMSTPGSVSHWIIALKQGDQGGAQPLWERYHARLLGLARKALRGARRREADEEDVVQNTFHSFFQGLARGRFSQLNDRDNLWRLLVVLTARKAIDQVRRERRQPRSGVTLQATPAISEIRDDDALLTIVGEEPTPELAALLVEQYESMLERLADEKLRQIAVWKLEGYTNGEIARKLSCSRRTVIRKLETIRLIWSES
jgi:RNA polymerase sigma factor (sigma-70 family)